MKVVLMNDEKGNPIYMPASKKHSKLITRETGQGMSMTLIIQLYRFYKARYKVVVLRDSIDQFREYEKIN